MPAFTLTERIGRQVTRDDLRGLVWVADFIYTECTETCPTQSLQFAHLEQEFAGAADLRLVSITVDPAHDTAAVLRSYAERYAASDRYACCAIDALGVAPMLGESIRIRSLCHHCGEPLEFSADPLGVGPGAEGIMMWAGKRCEGEQRAWTST